MQQEEQQKKFLIASIIPQRLSEEDAFRDIKEVRDLVDAYGGKVVNYVLQHRETHDKGMYLGSGKLEEIAELVKEQKIAVVVLNAMVKAGQIFDIKQLLHKSNPDIEVWDRVDLILQIFSQHAATAEAKLQIELAAMRHMGPRIYGMGYILSRQGGSIGTRGIGETNTELMKRHWRDQMKKVQDKLTKLSDERERQLQRRQKAGLQTVSIIGYTNAGKTSLYNRLSRKHKLTQNVLFATLDSNASKLFLPRQKKEIVLTDTIGFIRNLPTRLIDAFRSTLMESMHADLLLHVIDISDPDMERKITAVEEVLSDLKAGNKKQLYIFNKIDAPHAVTKDELKEKYTYAHPQFISVTMDAGIDQLLRTIEDELEQQEESTLEPLPQLTQEISH
jgi:GTP-binding protein HflX